MRSGFDLTTPLPGASFGGRFTLSTAGAHALIATAEQDPDLLPRLLDDCHGLLLLPGMQAMAEQPGRCWYASEAASARRSRTTARP